MFENKLISFRHLMTLRTYTEFGVNVQSCKLQNPKGLISDYTSRGRSKIEIIILSLNRGKYIILYFYIPNFHIHA